MSFKDLMEDSAERRDSNIILALDLTIEEPDRLLSRSLDILRSTHPYICAVKINRHLTLPLGLLNGVREILNLAEKLELPKIMDCKINDIGYTNRVIAEQYFKAGFDAVTANPLVGWEEGLQPVFEVARDMGRGVILLVYMSHRASDEGYGRRVYEEETGKIRPQYLIFAEKALSWGADGAVVGATYPDKISEVYGILGESVPIYSPGIGFQGGMVEDAVTSGARYLIVGRSITRAGDPGEAARSIRDLARRALRP